MEDDFELIISWMLEQTRSAAGLHVLFGPGVGLDEVIEVDKSPEVQEAIRRYVDDLEGWQRILDEYQRRWDEITLDSTE